MVSDTGWIAPAPIPWISRKAIIAGIDQAKPHRGRGRQEHRDAGEQHGFAPMDVGELAEHDGGGGLGEEEAGEDPGVERQPAELADDAGIAVEMMVASIATIAIAAITAAITRGRRVVREVVREVVMVAGFGAGEGTRIAAKPIRPESPGAGCRPDPRNRDLLGVSHRQGRGVLDPLHREAELTS